MPLEINITAEDIDALVRESIMKSGFGAAVVAGITKAMSGYDNPVDRAIKEYVHEVARELVRDKCATQIKTAIAAHIEAKVTPEILDSIVNAATEKMMRAASDRY